MSLQMYLLSWDSSLMSLGTRISSLDVLQRHYRRPLLAELLADVVAGDYRFWCRPALLGTPVDLLRFLFLSARKTLLKYMCA